MGNISRNSQRRRASVSKKIILSFKGLDCLMRLKRPLGLPITESLCASCTNCSLAWLLAFESRWFLPPVAYLRARLFWTLLNSNAPSAQDAWLNSRISQITPKRFLDNFLRGQLPTVKARKTWIIKSKSFNLAKFAFLLDEQTERRVDSTSESRLSRGLSVLVLIRLPMAVHKG